MSGYIRHMAGGGKAKSDLAKRLIESLTNKNVVEDAFPARKYGDRLMEMRNKTRDTGHEYMLFDPGNDVGTLLTSHEPHQIKLPDWVRELLPGSASIHTHPKGTPIPSTGDMAVWGAPTGGWGNHDLTVFGMPEGAKRIPDFITNPPRDHGREAPPEMFGAFRVKANKAQDPLSVREAYGRDMGDAGRIWHDPSRMMKLALEYDKHVADQLVYSIPALRLIKNNPELATGYWAKNPDAPRGGVDPEDLISKYIDGIGKFWKRGGHLRKAA